MQNNQPLLIYIVGRTSLSSSLDGGRVIDFGEDYLKGRLKLRDVKAALDKHADVTLVVSSHDAVCWVVEPEFNAPPPSDIAEATRHAFVHGNGVRCAGEMSMVSGLTEELVTDILAEEFAKLSPGQAIPDLSVNTEFKAAFIEAFEGIEQIVYEEMKSGSRCRNTELVGLTFAEEDMRGRRSGGRGRGMRWRNISEISPCWRIMLGRHDRQTVPGGRADDTGRMRGRGRREVQLAK